MRGNPLAHCVESYMVCWRAFCAIRNSVGIPYCIKKSYWAGSGSGGKVDVVEATQPRRRILQAGSFFITFYFIFNHFYSLLYS